MSAASLATLPAPRGHPILGQSREFNRDQLAYITRLARDFGDVVPLRLFPYRVVFFNRADLAEQVLATKQRAFEKGLIFRRLGEMLGEGLITSEYDRWVKDRRLMQPGFHHERIAAFGAMMAESARRLIQEWQDGEEREIQAEMMQLTLDIVCRTMFDADVTGDASEFDVAFTNALRAIHDRISGLQIVLPGSVPTPARVRLWLATRRLDRTVYRIIREHRESGDRGDIVSMLLAARDEDGAPLTDRQVRDQVLTLISAGHETSAVALTWTWHLLAQHPEVEARLHAEVDAVLGDRAPTSEDFSRLTYTGHVVSEVLRLYPPVWLITRAAAEDVEIGGYRLRRGDGAIVSQWTIQRDARYFERPDAFEPERWSNGLMKQLPRFAYFPFGAGPRQCVGHGFALLETVLVLATIARRFQLRPVPGHPVIPQGGITLRARTGVRMRLERRSR